MPTFNDDDDDFELDGEIADVDPDHFDSIEDEPWPDLLEDDVRDEEEDDEPDARDFDLPDDFRYDDP